MADLGDAAEALGQADQFVGFVQRSGHRLFNENVYSRFHQCARNLKMLESGNRDRGSLNFAVRSSELLDGSEATTAELAGDGISASKVSIHHADQAHRLTLLRKLLVNAGMIAPERTYTDDRNVYKILKIHRHAPSGRDDQTTKEQQGYQIKILVLKSSA